MTADAFTFEILYQCAKHPIAAVDDVNKQIIEAGGFLDVTVVMPPYLVKRIYTAARVYGETPDSIILEALDSWLKTKEGFLKDK